MMEESHLNKPPFLDFFELLRTVGLPVSVREWLTFCEACEQGLIGADLGRFYAIARATLIKSEKHYDIFDQCFAHYFADAKVPDSIAESFWNWLQQPLDAALFSEEQLANLEHLDLEELKKRFEERMAEQTERHDGGNHWIGTGGTSPFGHGGNHPTGIRVGGSGRGGRAVQIAATRRFKNYRRDLTLDIRQMGVALRRLRRLGRTGQRTEVDISGTISATAKNAGDLDIEFQAPRENRLHIVLLMDVGGSMDPFARLVSQLFSAAHQATHFKSFRALYFHNCIYDRVYDDAELYRAQKTIDFLNETKKETRLVIVGDAHMAPYELLARYGAIDYYERNEQAGLSWLQRLANHFHSSVWLNPIPSRYWGHPTISSISEVFSMFELTLDGLDDAIASLQ